LNIIYNFDNEFRVKENSFLIFDSLFSSNFVQKELTNV